MENFFELNNLLNNHIDANNFWEAKPKNQLANYFSNIEKTSLRKVKITISGNPNGKTYLARTYPVELEKYYYEVPVYDLYCIWD